MPGWEGGTCTFRLLSQLLHELDRSCDLGWSPQQGLPGTKLLSRILDMQPSDGLSKITPKTRDSRDYLLALQDNLGLGGHSPARYPRVGELSFDRDKAN